jgi:putative glycosyltransferase (TIGR04348 family)
MKISIICPGYGKGPIRGNVVTAERWARLLRKLGNRVRLAPAYSGEACDLLIALHARRSAPSIRDFRRRHPRGLMVVALTGTDIYQDLPHSRTVPDSLQLASAIVALQPEAIRVVPPEHRAKARFIYQSATGFPAPDRSASRPTFDLCVIGNLRPVKDPFRAALAVRDLPPSSRLRVVHLGAATNARDQKRATAEMERNPRYRWLGTRGPAAVRRILHRSFLLVLSSRAEGGANVISEAVAAGIPVLASRIPGSIGMLGNDYPGYFPVGDTAALRELLIRAETDGSFLRRLRARCRRLAKLFDPARETAAWKKLLRELTDADSIPPRRKTDTRQPRS